ncbi:MAG TPA: DUF4340 domain-containing protein [Deltaproteobacteria bacterium]|nr:DUF4340 domain-containing protein [Deltaproteobacteria bacterium]
MKIKKEYLVLILIIFALSGYLYFKSTDRLHYELPAVPHIVPGELTRMEISSKDQGLSLVKKDEAWYLQPGDYPVDAKKVEAMLAVLKDLSITEMVSESRNYLLYELDEESRITVKAYAGSSPVREFDIGKTAATYKHTYIRPAGDERVYHAKGSFRKDFEHTSADIRDKQVLAFNKGEIQSVKIAAAGTFTTINREDVPRDDPQQNTQATAMDIQWKNQDGSPAEKETMDNLLNRLSTLSCKEYIEGRQKDEMGSPENTIVLSSGTRDYVLSLYAKDSGTAPASSSRNDYVFILTAENLEEIETAVKKLMKASTEP